MKNRRIGLFGGTFDPVHAGHLTISCQAALEVQLDQVIFFPAVDPPHKKKPAAAYRHRVAMLEAALAGLPAAEADRFAVSLLEAELSVPSYTVDTLVELQRRVTTPSGCSFYFLIGADSLLELHLWYQYQKLLRLTNFIVISRPGIPFADMRQAIAALPGPFLPDSSGRLWTGTDGTELMLLHNRLTEDISSSGIRRQLQQGRQPEGMPERVREYIAAQGLYPARG
ncbi:MAG: nicotinate (nicotinamide) nucleotide adenylyltransferase [Candidatus Electrothrix sp. YB6]